jgi:hypothetical protein
VVHVTGCSIQYNGVLEVRVMHHCQPVVGVGVRVVWVCTVCLIFMVWPNCPSPCCITWGGVYAWNPKGIYFFAEIIFCSYTLSIV